MNNRRVPSPARVPIPPTRRGGPSSTSSSVVTSRRTTPAASSAHQSRAGSSASESRTTSRSASGGGLAFRPSVIPPRILGLPPPDGFSIREDADTGVPQVIHTTFEEIGWSVYETTSSEQQQGVVPTSNSHSPPPVSTASSSSSRPPRAAGSSSGTSSRTTTRGHSSSSLANSNTQNHAAIAASSTWRTFPPFHIHWKTNRFFASEQAACIAPYMRVNHFPWSNEITLKDALYRNIRRMKNVYGALLYGSLHPESFTVPNEYLKFSDHFTVIYQKHLDAKAAHAKLVAEHERLIEAATTSADGEAVLQEQQPPPPPPPQPIFICKPTDMSRGRKIFLFRSLSELTYDQPSIVQSYIERPLLLEGRRKVDFRIYVLVTSYHPLTVYIYHEFLARFSAAAYDESDITNNFAHLTNYAISRTYEGGGQAPSSASGGGMMSVGVKWDGASTRAYFSRKFDIDFDAVVWPRIMQAVNLTLLSIVMSPSFTPTPEAGRAAAPCFELYGFDILLDAVSFQPWLVEVNYSPSLAIEMPVDVKVKTALIKDIVGVLNIPMAPPPPASTSSTSPPPVASHPQPSACSTSVRQQQHPTPSPLPSPISSSLGRAYGDFMPCFPPSVAPTSTISTAELNSAHLESKCYASFPPPFVAAVEAFRSATGGGGKQVVTDAFKELTLELRKVENGLKARGTRGVEKLVQV